jgi:membrane protein
MRRIPESILMKKQLKRFYFLLAQSLGHFYRADCFSLASALSYTTLLSIVPLAILGLGLLSGFPAFQTYVVEIEHFILKHFVPSSAVSIKSYIETVAASGAKMSLVGLISSLLTGVLLIFTMEGALNAVWQIKRGPHRKGMAAFLLYWSILTLLPILAVCVFAASFYIYRISHVYKAIQIITSYVPMLFIVDIIFTWIAFTLIYIILPNAKVRFRHAALGALIGAIIFESMKNAFSFFATFYFTDLFIYGALAVFPVFLMWLYLSWIIVLFGAVIAYEAGKKSP